MEELEESDRLKQYAEEMPIELRRAIEALSDNFRLGIFFVLFRYGEMSFSQIRQELGIQTNNSGLLSYHLRKLENSALIKNDYSKKTKSTNYSFYDVTEFGERFIDGLIKSIEIPRKNMGQFTSNATGFIDYKILDTANVYEGRQTMMV